MSEPTEFAPGVEFDSSSAGDIYFGKPEALIAAGLLTAEQVPGWPGMPATGATFVDGVQQPRWTKVRHDEHWMHVGRVGNNIRLTKGIGAEEARRRAAAAQAELEEAERNRPKQDTGIANVEKAMRDASAIFPVGATVLADGDPCVITGEFKLRTTWHEDGEFVGAEGRRFNYRWGYVGRFRSGEEYFFAAHQIRKLEEGHAPTHLRPVGVATKKAVSVGRTEFKERQ